MAGDAFDELDGLELPFTGSENVASLQRLHATHAELGKQYLAAAVSDVKETIGNILQECRNCGSDCTDCVKGRIGVLADSAKNYSDQFVIKILQYIQGKIEAGSGYTLAAMSEMGLLENPDGSSITGEPAELKPFDPKTIPDVLTTAVTNGQQWREIRDGSITLGLPDDQATGGTLISDTPVSVNPPSSGEATNPFPGGVDCSKGPDVCKPNALPHYSNGVFDGCVDARTFTFYPCKGSSTVPTGNGCTDLYPVCGIPNGICGSSTVSCDDTTTSGGQCIDNPVVTRCDVGLCETECLSHGGKWTPFPNNKDGGICEIVTSQGTGRYTCYAEGKQPSQPCFLSDKDCKAFVAADKTGRYEYVPSGSNALSGMVHDTLVDKWFHCDGSDCQPDPCCNGGSAVSDSLIQGVNAPDDDEFSADYYEPKDDDEDFDTWDFDDTEDESGKKPASQPTATAPPTTLDKPWSSDLMPVQDCQLKEWQAADERLDALDRVGDKAIDAILAKLYNAQRKISSGTIKSISLYGSLAKIVVGALAVVPLMGVKFVFATGRFVIELIGTPGGCKGDSWALMSVIRGFTNLFGGWFGFIPPQLTNYIDRNVNLACQTLIPPKTELDVARLRKKITKPEWEFATKQYGICLEDAEKAYCAATEYIPGPSDLVSFMVRDVFDESVVEKFQLDSDFTEKFVGDAKEWAEKQGMTEDQFKYYWRSHWQLPSVGQAFDMYHRNRSDAGVTAPDGTPLVFTYDDLTDLMKIADVAPGFIDQLASIANPPLNKRDIRSAYSNLALDDEDLPGRFQDLGYTEENAKILAEYIKTVDGPNRAKLQGYLTPQALDNMYLADQINDDDYQTLIGQAGVKQESITQRMSSLKIRRSARNTKESLTVLKNAYVRGRLSDDQYRTELDKLGLSETQKSTIFGLASLQRSVSDKQIQIAKLCKLVKQGYISAPDYIERAKNLGFSEYNASILAQSCNADILLEVEKEQQKALREQQAAAEKAERKAGTFQKNRRAAQIARWPFAPATKPKAKTPEQQPPEPYLPGAVPPQKPV